MFFYGIHGIEQISAPSGATFYYTAGYSGSAVMPNSFCTAAAGRSAFAMPATASGRKRTIQSKTSVAPDEETTLPVTVIKDGTVMQSGQALARMQIDQIAASVAPVLANETGNQSSFTG